MFAGYIQFSVQVCQIGLRALVHTATLSSVHLSFTFLYVDVHKLPPFLVRLSNLHTVLFQIFVRVPT